jgi:hypothetical protein
VAYGEDVTGDALRMALKRSGGVAVPSAQVRSSESVRKIQESVAKITDHESYNSVLVIPDQHFPYQHQDAIDFLAAVKEAYDPDYIVNIGDEADKHALSYHDSDPDLPSAGDELRKTIEAMQPLYELFPEVTVMDSNHGSLAMRKAKTHGIPRKYMRTYAEVLEAPPGWQWCHELNLNCDGVPVRFRHDFGSDVLRAAEQAACCLVQGHYHSSFMIQYSGNTDRLIWASTVGCLIDDESLAFAYNKIARKRPILGCLVIQNGYPILIPMILSKGGKWVGEIP